LLAQDSPGDANHPRPVGRRNQRLAQVDKRACRTRNPRPGTSKLLGQGAVLGEPGIDAHPSPIGKFAIITKLKSMVMRGQSDIKGRMYNIPDVPFDMNFYSVFYIHGAYWHNAFGHKHSGGCINFRTPDAEWLYNWSDPLPIGNMTWATQSNPGTTVWVIP